MAPTGVVIVDSSYEDVGEALDRIFERFPLDVKGRTVLVKPNILGPFPPESHVNTAPEVVRGIVQRLQSAGGEVTVADNPGARGYGAVERSAQVSGIMEASLGTYANISTEQRTVRLPDSGVSVSVSERVLDADVLVSVPKFKTHILTQISGAVKNSFGFVVGGGKTGLHRDIPGYVPFSRMLVEVYRLRVPDLVVMDGIVGMEGNGPSSTKLYPVGKMLASDNGVALDAVMATMMGMNAGKVAMLERASELGLGEIDLSRLEIEGDASPLPGFSRPSSAIAQRMPAPLVRALYPDLDRARFDVSPELCNSCANCRDICPAGAITMEEERPSYDYAKCISCYCCMELCPRQALERHDSLRTRLYRRLGIL